MRRKSTTAAGVTSGDVARAQQHATSVKKLDGAKGLGDFLERWVPRHVFYAMPVLGSAVSTFLCADQAQEPDSTEFLVLGILSAAVTAGIPLWRQWASDRAGRRDRAALQVVRRDYDIALGRYVAPISEALARFVRLKNTEERNRLRGQLANMILNAMLELSGCVDARVAFYAYNQAPNPDERDLVLSHWYGRRTRPRQIFKRADTDPRSQAVHRLVLDLAVELDDNVATSKDAHLYAGKDYTTYLAASVFAGNEPLGMLAIDSPVAGSLTESHKEVIKALAPLLAASQAR